MNKENLINIGKPIVLLNGLVTDQNKYTDEQKIELLKSKKDLKFKVPKNPKIINHSNHSSEKENKKNKMDLSLEEDDDGVKIISSLNTLSSKKKERKEEDSQEKRDSAKSSKKKQDFNIISKSVNKEMFKINLGTKKEKLKKERTKTKNRTEIKKSQNRKKDKIKDTSNIKVSDFSDNTENSVSKIINFEKKQDKNSIQKFSVRKSSTRKTDLTKFFTKKEEDSEINVEYSEVPEVNTYEEIIKKRKMDNSCVKISLIEPEALKNIIEDKSQIFTLNKKLKKEKKENIIISDKDNEIDLTKALLYLFKSNNKIELFKKLSPEYNNILQYMPIHYTGINNYGYMNINYCTNNISINTYNKYEDEIHFITNFFNDKNSQYKLYFRKYILNLSCFKSNESLQNDHDYNIYHIIIPKKSWNKINIDFNEETTLNSLIKKLNCDYFFYCQKPGELLIVEPETILLSYYSKEKTAINQNFEKNYLIMFWNKMNRDSFQDYLTLQNICKNEKYKNFPIINTLVNLINNQSSILSTDIIKIILEIYNDFDTYENINQYINEINDNNIRFHKLFLNGIYLCQYCQQEIFNFYVYEQRNKNNNIKSNNHYDKNMLIECEDNNNMIDNIDQNEGQFICINCAYRKKFFNEEKNIIFFKYNKDEINNFVSAISSKINNKFRNKEKKEIISEAFNKKKKDDCINMDEFLLKIDGPLRILDKEFEKNKNDLLSNDIVVDKYLKIFANKDNNVNNNDNNKSNIDPLNPVNFKNDVKENDIYEKLGLELDYPMDIPYELIEPKMISNKSENKINSNVNYIPINNSDIFNYNHYNNFFELRDNSFSDNKKKEIEKEKEKKNISSNKSSNKGSRKNKKKNGTNLADIIFSGEF